MEPFVPKPEWLKDVTDIVLAKDVEAIADAICDGLGNWLKEPLHRMAYEDAARAAIVAMRKQ